jgi:hypothetical protein
MQYMLSENLVILITIETIMLLCYPWILCRAHANGRKLNGDALPDIIHDHVGCNKWFGILADFGVICALAFFAMAVIVTGQLKYVAYFFVYIILAHIIYTAYCISTTLPDSKGGTCSYNNTLNDIFKEMGSCNMLNISGHLLIIGITLFLLSLMQKHQYAPLYMVVYACMFFVIVASRNHYTVDCLTSTVVCGLFFTNHRAIMHILL